jgi:endonuclease YncB( thermonuclease family)
VKRTQSQPFLTKTYSELRRKIESVFERGRQLAELTASEIKTRMRWETGKWLEGHLLFHKDRAGYGAKIIQNLARDLGKSKTLLYDALRFARQNPIFRTYGKLDLSHSVRLLSVKDRAERSQLADEASEKGWSMKVIRSKIKSIRRKRRRGKKKLTRLIPKLGQMHTCQAASAIDLKTGEPMLKLDLGFSVFEPLSGRSQSRFKEGEIVSYAGRGLKKLPKATKRDLYTYRAYVLRVIDADTVYVEIDLGFGTATKQKLRLRGIDAPELKTKAGKRAKAFVEAKLKDSPFITITTTKPDKFDRYLTDLYYGPNQTYLNQLLLDEGFAKLAGN